MALPSPVRAGLLAGAVLPLLLLAGPAGAHGGLMPSTVPAGSTTALSFVLAHGCGPGGTIPASAGEALATTAVTLELPAGVSATPDPADGWRGVATPGGDGTGGTLRWEPTGAVDPAPPVFLALTVTVPDLPDGTELLLPTVQECGPEQLAWVDDGDADQAILPAPALTVGTDPAAMVPSAAPGWGGTAGAAALVAVVSVTGGVVVWRRMTPPPERTTRARP